CALRARAAGHCPRTLKNCDNSSDPTAMLRFGCSANALLEGLSGYLLGTCLLKLVFCCVRVSNHVLSRRVALLAPRSASRGVGADLVRLCRLQRRHVDTIFAGRQQSVQLSA